MDYYGLTWTTMDYHGLSWTFMDYHGLIWTVMDYHGLSWTTMDYHRLPWTNMDYHINYFCKLISDLYTLTDIGTCQVAIATEKQIFLKFDMKC